MRICSSSLFASHPLSFPSKMKPRLSSLRQDILRLLETQSSLPLCAQEIHRAFPEVHKTSIYRALDYLQNEGLVESFILPCHETGTQTYYLASSQHTHFFHCESCHQFFPLDKCPLPSDVFDRPYRITQHVFYLVGICPECLSHNSQNSGDETAKAHNER